MHPRRNSRKDIHAGRHVAKDAPLKKLVERRTLEGAQLFKRRKLEEAHIKIHA